MLLKLFMDILELNVYKVHINDYTGLSLAYFMAGSNLVIIRVLLPGQDVR